MAISDLIRRRRASIGLVAAVLVAAGVLQFAGVNPAASQSVTLTAYMASEDPGLDANSPTWNETPRVQVPLTAQQGAYAAGGGSIPVVIAKALHYGDRLYLRVEWEDPTQDESTARVQDFSDAVAVEFPARSATSVPSICMGQADAGVNIWQWRADSQAGIKDPAELYTGALVDGYPSKDTLFYTARAAGNPYAIVPTDPDAAPMQTLVSQAFGTLSKANVQDVHGRGSYQDGKWVVVFTRQFTGGDVDQASFGKGVSTDMAFAVWNGSEGDRNGRKSVSQFVRLSLASNGIPRGFEGNPWLWAFAGATLAGIIALGLGLGYYGYREGRVRR